MREGGGCYDWLSEGVESYDWLGAGGVVSSLDDDGGLQFSTAGKCVVTTDGRRRF